MRFAAALRIAVRVASVRSAWVRRRGGPSDRRADFCGAGAGRLAMLDLDLNLAVDDGDGIRFQWNLTGHAGWRAGRDVESTEMKGAFHGFSDDDSFFGKRRLAMGAHVG